MSILKTNMILARLSGFTLKKAGIIMNPTFWKVQMQTLLHGKSLSIIMMAMLSELKMVTMLLQLKVKLVDFAFIEKMMVTVVLLKE